MIYQPSQNLDTDAQQFLLYHQNILDAQHRAYEYLHQFWFALAQMLQQNQNFKLKPHIELIPSLHNQAIGLRYYMPLDETHTLKFSLYDVRHQLVSNGSFISCSIKMQSQKNELDLKKILQHHQLTELLKPILAEDLIVFSQTDESPYLIALPMLLSNIQEDLQQINQIFSQILKIINQDLSQKIPQNFDDELPSNHYISEKNIQLSQENYSISKILFDPIQLSNTDRTENHLINPKETPTHIEQKSLYSENLDEKVAYQAKNREYSEAKINTQVTDTDDEIKLKNSKMTDRKTAYQQITQVSNPIKNQENLPDTHQSKFSFVKPILDQEHTNQHKLQSILKALSEIRLDPVKMNPYQKGGMMIWLSDRSYLNLSPDGNVQCEGKMKDILNHLLESKNLI